MLSDYDSGVVGLCTKFVDAGILSSAGVSDAASNGAGAAVSNDGSPVVLCCSRYLDSNKLIPSV